MSLYVQRNGEVISADSRSLISKRYCTVTSAMNREFWNITSDRQNSIYVGSYGRGTAIDTSDIAWVKFLDILLIKYSKG